MNMVSEEGWWVLLLTHNSHIFWEKIFYPASGGGWQKSGRAAASRDGGRGELFVSFFFCFYLVGNLKKHDILSIFMTWQLRVARKSIHNSCNALLRLFTCSLLRRRPWLFAHFCNLFTFCETTFNRAARRHFPKVLFLNHILFRSLRSWGCLSDIRRIEKLHCDKTIVFAAKQARKSLEQHSTQFYIQILKHVELSKYKIS